MLTLIPHSDPIPDSIAANKAAALATGHSSQTTRQKKCHTVQSLFARNPLKTNDPYTKEPSHFLEQVFLGSPISRSAVFLSRESGHRSSQQKKWDTEPLLFQAKQLKTKE